MTDGWSAVSVQMHDERDAASKPDAREGAADRVSPRWIAKGYRRIASGTVCHGEDVEDLAQETFLRMQTRYPAQLADWPLVRAIARNLVRESARRAWSRPRLEQANDADPSETRRTERASAGQREVLEKLSLALAELPDALRHVLVLHELEGLPYLDVARMLDIPTRTARSRCMRARSELRRVLERRGVRSEDVAAILPMLAWRRKPKLVRRLVQTRAAVAFLVAVPAAMLVYVTLRPLRGTQGDLDEPLVTAEPSAPGDSRWARDLEQPARPDAQRFALPRAPDEVDDEPRTVTTRIHGRVVDELDDGRPLPEFALYLGNREGNEEWLVTDAEGRFESRRTYAEGPVDVLLRDRLPHSVAIGGMLSPGRGEGDVTLEHTVTDDEPVEIAVRSGPTFRLELELDAGVSPSDVVGELRPDPPEEDPSKGLYAPVHPGPPPWIRFEWDGYCVGAREAHLQFGTRDGLWWGTVAIDPPHGFAAEPVRVRLDPVGCLVGTILLDGDRRAYSVNVHAVDEEGGVGRRVRFQLAGVWDENLAVLRRTAGIAPRRARIAPDGTEVPQGAAIPSGSRDRIVATVYMVPYLQPGRYWVRVQGSARRVVAEPALVVVTAGAVTRCDFRIDPKRPKSPLASGSVPPRAYESHASAPPVPVVRLRFVVTDAETKQPLVTFDWRASSLEGDDSWDENVRELELERPLDSHLEWVIDHPSYQPYWGSRLPGPAAGPTETIEVELSPGWGTEVWVRDQHERPVAGAGVLLDGTPAGETGPDGTLRVARSQRPRHMAVVHERLVIEPGWDVNPLTGEHTASDIARTLVYLQRR